MYQWQKKGVRNLFQRKVPDTFSPPFSPPFSSPPPHRQQTGVAAEAGRQPTAASVRAVNPRQHRPAWPGTASCGDRPSTDRRNGLSRQPRTTVPRIEKLGIMVGKSP